MRQPLAVERLRHLARRAGDGLRRAPTAPFAFINGGATPLEARIESAPIAADLQRRRRTTIRAPQLTGAPEALDAIAAPLRLLARQPDRPRLDARAGERLRARPPSTRTVLSVENAEFTLDGNNASGALKIDDRPEARRHRHARLQHARPDALFRRPVRLRSRTSSDWRDVSLSTDWFDDIERRHPAFRESVRLGDADAGDTAASVSLRDARLEIGLARADFSGGSLTGGPCGHRSAAQQRRRRSRRSFARPRFDLRRRGPPSLGLPPGVSGTASVLIDVDHAAAAISARSSRRLGGTARLECRGRRRSALRHRRVAAAAGGRAARCRPAARGRRR